MISDAITFLLILAASASVVVLGAIAGAVAGLFWFLGRANRRKRDDEWPKW